MMSVIAPIVKKTAIGSLLPDSNSRRWRKFPFRLARRDRRVEKTAAASVDETIAPRRNASRGVNPRRKNAPRLMISAVRATPTVDRVRALVNTGFTSVHLVSIPPEKRIMARATTPMNWARTGSSNWIPPGPSEPASMPTTMKIKRAGTPSLPETLLERMLMTTRAAAPRMMSSPAGNMDFSSSPGDQVLAL